MGRAGVAVVRISGPSSFQALTALTGIEKPVPRHATVSFLRCPKKGHVLDHALTLAFPGPQSFTGEDVVELHLHGGPAIVDAVLHTLSEMDGMTRALAGEFSRRAFLNHKMNLVEIEGLADLLVAETEAQRNEAMRHYRSESTKVIQRWRSELLHALAHLEAYIDFSEDEDIEDGVVTDVIFSVERVSSEMSEQLQTAKNGERLRHGVKLVLTGSPNVGKSSLLNILSNNDRAIVSEMAGTTRDVLSVDAVLGGFPVVFVDTAGLRFGRKVDQVEQEGVRRALKATAEADIRLCVQDAADLKTHCSVLNGPLQCRCEDSDKKTILAFNKMDRLATTISQLRTDSVTIIPISCQTRDGIPKLIDQLTVETKRLCETSSTVGPVMARQRQLDHVRKAQTALMQVLQNSDDVVRMAEELRTALYEVGMLTGQVQLEEMLDIVFADFCIGK